jgi:hypothetical protein
MHIKPHPIANPLDFIDFFTVASIKDAQHKIEVTFVYQKLLLFLSIAKAMAYHHALACISSPQAYIINRRLYRFRNDDIQNCVLMIYRNKLRMIYKATP